MPAPAPPVIPLEPLLTCKNTGQPTKAARVVKPAPMEAEEIRKAIIAGQRALLGQQVSKNSASTPPPQKRPGSYGTPHSGPPLRPGPAQKPVATPPDNFPEGNTPTESTELGAAYRAESTDTSACAAARLPPTPSGTGPGAFPRIREPPTPDRPRRPPRSVSQPDTSPRNSRDITTTSTGTAQVVAPLFPTVVRDTAGPGLTGRDSTPPGQQQGTQHDSRHRRPAEGERIRRPERRAGANGTWVSRPGSPFPRKGRSPEDLTPRCFCRRPRRPQP